jgi:hypothetical protein
VKIFLCGLSGTGKTTIGNQLAERGWTHFDCEVEHLSNPNWISNPLASLPDGENVIASWGFILHFIETVWEIIDAGYTPVLLHGKDEHRYESLLERGESKAFSTASAFSGSRQRIAIRSLEPDMMLNTFRPDGSRWDVASLIHSIYWTA